MRAPILKAKLLSWLGLTWKITKWKLANSKLNDMLYDELDESGLVIQQMMDFSEVINRKSNSINLNLVAIHMDHAAR